MQFTQAEKGEALAYWGSLRAKLAARLEALEEGRLHDELPPSGRGTFWQTADAQTLRDVIDHTDEQIALLRKARCID
jgi:hypothetical protein